MAASLGREICRVAGAVQYSSVNSVPAFTKPGYLSIHRVASDTFYLVMVANVPRVVKKAKLQKNLFSINSREQHMTIVIKGAGGVNISIRNAAPEELQVFKELLQQLMLKGKVVCSSSPTGNDDDIENQPLNRNPVKSKQSSVVKSPMPLKTYGRWSTDSLAALIKKPITPPQQVGSAKKQLKKVPLHERTRDTNTFCDSSGSKRSASSFYGTSQSSESPRSWTPKSSTKRPSYMANDSPLFKSREKPLFEEETALTGFSNLGNTCYMNSILQSLLGLTSFAQDMNNEALLRKVGSTSLYKSLHSLLACKMAGGSSSDLRPYLRRVKEAISEAATRFSGHMQHDAQEFLCQVLDQLKTDVGTDAEMTCPVSRNFEARVIHTMCCQQCGFSASTEERSYDLSLQINSTVSDRFSSYGSTAVCLDKLIRTYFEDEVIEFSCEKCSHTKALSTHRFCKVPRVLILHLQRSDYNRITEQRAKKKYRISLPQHIGIDDLCVDQVKPPAALKMKPARKFTPGKSPRLKNASPETRNAGKENSRTPQARRRLKPSFCSSVFERSFQKNKQSPPNETAVLTDCSIDGGSSPKRDSTSDESDYVTKVCKLSEDDQVKHAMELSAKEAVREQKELERMIELSVKQARMSQRRNAHVNQQKTESSVFAARNRIRHDSDDEEFGLLGGIGVESEDPFLASYQRVMNSSKAEFSSRRRRFSSPPQKSEQITIISSDEGDDKWSLPRDGPSKRGWERSKLLTNDTNSDTDEDFQSKRRRTYSSSEKSHKAKDTNLCSLMDRKPTLSKFEGDLLSQTPKKVTVTPFAVNKDTKEKAEKSSWSPLEVSTFSEDEIAKAIALSLQDQSDDEQLNQALEMSMQEFTNDFSMDQEQRYPVAELPSCEMDATKQEHCYELVSVVSHFGSTSESGHYISDVYDCKAEQWTSYDDSTATKVEEHTVRFGRARTAYIAFYLHRQCVQAIKTGNPESRGR